MCVLISIELSVLLWLRGKNEISLACVSCSCLPQLGKVVLRCSKLYRNEMISSSHLHLANGSRGAGNGCTSVTSSSCYIFFFLFYTSGYSSVVFLSQNDLVSLKLSVIQMTSRELTSTGIENYHRVSKSSQVLYLVN